MREVPNRQTLITDLLDGQYSNAVRIVAFNTAEGWSRDVSAEFADLILQRCARDGFDVPPSLELSATRLITDRAPPGRANLQAWASAYSVNSAMIAGMSPGFS